MKAGDRVMVEMPGVDYHRKIGRIVEVSPDPDLGTLYCIAIDGYPAAFGLTAPNFRYLADDALDSQRSLPLFARAAE